MANQTPSGFLAAIARLRRRRPLRAAVAATAGLLAASGISLALASTVSTIDSGVPTAAPRAKLAPSGPVAPVGPFTLAPTSTGSTATPTATSTLVPAVTSTPAPTSVPEPAATQQAQGAELPHSAIAFGLAANQSADEPAAEPPAVPVIAPIVPEPVPEPPAATPPPAAALPPALPEPEPEPGPDFYLPAAVGGDPALESRLLDGINRERANAGLAPYALDGVLVEIARTRSQQMADQGYFGHQDANGRYMYTELLAWYGIAYAWAGENLALNNYSAAESPERALISLMNSPGHRANILADDFSRIGVGVVVHEDGRRYYSMIFIG